MADGVFGTPIDVTTLKGMHEYVGMKIRRSDLAKVARDRMSDNGKDRACVQYVEGLKSSYGAGVCTMGTIYNATGGDLNFVGNHDWTGNTYDKPYPIIIKNGQWAGFLHVHPAFPPTDGSCGAVVYRGYNEYGSACDWALVWTVPWVFAVNQVYCEIREEGHFNGEGTWWVIHNKLLKGGTSCNERWNGCKCDEQIGSSNNPTFLAIMSIDDPSPPYQPA